MIISAFGMIRTVLVAEKQVFYIRMNAVEFSPKKLNELVAVSVSCVRV